MNMQQIMKQAQKMQKELQKTQIELENTHYEGKSSLVSVVLDGNKNIISVASVYLNRKFLRFIKMNINLFIIKTVSSIKAYRPY